MSEKILERCPCCGDASDYDTDEEIDGWFAFCMNRSCGCRSGIFPTRPMARNAWNTRLSSPAQEPRFDSVAQRIERSEPDEGRRDAGSNPVAIGPAQEPVTTEPVAWHEVMAECRVEINRQKERCRSDSDAFPYEQLLGKIDSALATPAPPQPGRDAVIEECAKVAESFRRQMLPGDDRVLIRKIEDAIRGLIGDPK